MAYQIQGIIGEGRHARVYNAVNDLGRRVAIKELKPEHRRDARRSDKFFRSAKSWAAICPLHSQIVNYLDKDAERGWIVMDRMEESAAARIAVAPTDPADVGRHLKDLLEALEQIHQAGLIHLNIKPTNLLFDAQRRVYLSDGVLVSRDNPGVVPTTHSKYLAPELPEEKFGAIGPGTDLYCLGFVMLELLAGPRFDDFFPGISDEVEVSWIRWHTSLDKAPSARDIAPNCPKQLAIVIDRLLVKDCLHRYQSCHDALEDIASIAETPAPRRPRSPTATPPVEIATPSVPERAPVAPSPPAVPPKPAARPTPSMILPRPASGVFLWLASGPGAGRMVPCDQDEFYVGFDEDCDLRLDVAQRHGPDSKCVIQRGAEGWTIRQVTGHGLIVNRDPVQGSAPLRSGDLVRLTWRGPDVQFVLQSQGSLAITEIGALYLKPRNRKTRRPDQRKRTLAPSRPEPPTHDFRPASPAAVLPPPGPAAPLPPLAREALYPSGPATAPAVAPPLRPTTTPSSQAAPVKVSRRNWKQLVDFNSWSKTTQLWATAVGGTILIVAAVILVPTEKSGKGASASSGVEQPGNPQESRDNTQTVPPPDSAGDGAAMAAPATGGEEISVSNAVDAK